MKKEYEVRVSIIAHGDFSNIPIGSHTGILAEPNILESEHFIWIDNNICSVIHNEIDLGGEYMDIFISMPIKANSEFEAEYIASYIVTNATLDKINVIDYETEQFHVIDVERVKFECEVFDDVA